MALARCTRTLFSCCLPFFPGKGCLLECPHVPPPLQVQCPPQPCSTTSHTLQGNKQIKVRTADHFFEVVAFAVVMTSG
ncbi:hypothetical protein Q5P01_020482 [Channa striata]|uniref:Uncharacterized protein n=1 Tax=Channa striata TaxID=64152 RepID=A0AA88S252_CHASR|nr:hypothetical protein Q5P01_020482 [Channa striata]